MIRMALRQFRAQALVAIAALVLVAIVLAITGTQLAHLYDTTVAGCKALGDCSSVDATFLTTDQLEQLIGIVLILVPGVMGVFWGAPLIAHELESGTHRLVWTQSVTRTRWLVTKLALVGLASAVAAGVLSLMVTWWFSPIDRVVLNQYSVFDQRDIVPIGYAVFAFVLGVTAGVLLRRTLPAMATTIVAFLAVRLALIYGVRPYLIGPAHLDMPLASNRGLVGFGGDSSGATVLAFSPHIANAWVYSTQIVDAAGRAPSSQLLNSYCPNIGAPGASLPSPTVFQTCIAQISAHFHLVVTYQPADRFWTLQWYETGIYIALAAVLAAVSFWWVRRRLS
jgi:ABC-type transport system involved in multi-copper enzyme maturation permease subunit